MSNLISLKPTQEEEKWFHEYSDKVIINHLEAAYDVLTPGWRENKI